MAGPVHELYMELRDVQPERREVSGVVAPYDEVTYLVPDPGGERIRRGAFAKTVAERGDRIPLFRDHDHRLRLGQSLSFTEGTVGLVGTFHVLGGPDGDSLLEHLRLGYLGSFSVGFQSVQAPIADDGVREVREARLVEVSAVALPAYAGAGVLAVRTAQNLDDLLAPFRVPAPIVDLSPIPPIWR